ncbi:MAG: DPP IV N-terminal domain-containing protein [Blastocatellia bacterium]|nr:DPP IV N-terminal domain-containing protein [Blastocatellia bacterium]
MIDKTLSVVLSALSFIGMIAMAGCRGEDRGSGGEPSVTNSEGEPLGSDTHPDWSPDGASIAFISNREGVRAGKAINFEIYRSAVDGSGEQRLTSNQDFEADLAWSPDGTKLLFKSYRDGNDEIYVMNSGGGNQRNLSNSPASDGGAIWSPDGSAILFHSDRRGGGESHFYLMNADGSNVRTLPNDPGPGHSPDWSPDGSRIAFVSSRDGNDEIYVMNADGSNVHRITTDPRVNGYPKWSPDGRTIAHTVGSFETDKWAVFFSDADGGNLRQVIEGTDSGNVAWSPDGKRLLFGRYKRYGKDGGEESRLFLFDLESRSETRVLQQRP